MSPGMFNDMWIGCAVFLVIAFLLGVGVTLGLQWLWPHLHISIGWR